MPKGKGYGGSYQPNNAGGGPLLTGTGKSNSMSASMNDSGGNMGKPIGDTGMKNKKGNSRTRCAADRYK